MESAFSYAPVLLLHGQSGYKICGVNRRETVLRTYLHRIKTALSNLVLIPCPAIRSQWRRRIINSPDLSGVKLNGTTVSRS